MSKIHLSLPNAYKLMCFDRNVNGNRDVKFLECDKWSLHWYENLTLVLVTLWYVITLMNYFRQNVLSTWNLLKILSHNKT